MPLKRSLAVASAISAAVIFGALAAGAVNGISNDPHNAGEYSPIDPSRSGPNSGQGGADPSSSIDAGNGASSAPDLATASGVASITGPNSSSSSGSGAKPIVKGSTVNGSTVNGSTVNGSAVNGSTPSTTVGAGPVNPPPGPEAPATTTTSFDDHGGNSGGGHGADG